MVVCILNSRNPHAKGFKAVVSLENWSMWLQQNDKPTSNLIALIDEKGELLRICKNPVTVLPSFEIFLMSNFTQDYLYLLFN